MQTQPTSSLTIVTEKEFGKKHEIFDGAPDEWAAARGATHTLWCGEGIGRGTRPAILKKTVAYIGVDETDEGGIKWEKWQVKTYMRIPKKA